MKRSISGLKLVLLVVWAFLALAERSRADAQSSFSDLDIEYNELKVAFDKMAAENQQLRQALSETQLTLREVRSNLASTSGESEIFKRQSSELKLRMEAFGIGSVNGGSEKIEQRLLGAVGNLRTLSEENTKLSKSLIRLSEAASLYAQSVTNSNPESRLALESEIRNTNEILGQTGNPSPKASTSKATNLDGLAISVKNDLSLVVVNLGHDQGVEVGMPFQVTRDGRTIGTVQIVDVRDKIAGAVIQYLISEKDPIKVGDHFEISAHKDGDHFKISAQE